MPYFFCLLNRFPEEEMACKQFDKSMGFAESALSSSMEKNRSLNVMNTINSVIDWSKIERLLLKRYKVGKSKEVADAYFTTFAFEMPPAPEVVSYSI